MADRVYPSSKANGATAAPNLSAGAPPMSTNPAPAKSHAYNPVRPPPYRLNPVQNRYKEKHRHFSFRRCVCLTCFWSILILLVVLLLAAIAAAVLYALYRPHRPLFSVTSLKISTLNLTTTPADDSTRLTSRVNVTVSAKNPNKKITFIYDPMSIAVQSNSVVLSNGSFANFTNPPDGISIIHAVMAMNEQLLDADSVKSLTSDLKSKSGVPMEIVMDTMVGVKLENLKMRKIGIRIRCDGIHGMMPRGKKVNPAVANTASAKCGVDPRIKILRWTF